MRPIALQQLLTLAKRNQLWLSDRIYMCAQGSGVLEATKVSLSALGAVAETISHAAAQLQQPWQHHVRCFPSVWSKSEICRRSLAAETECARLVYHGSASDCRKQEENTRKSSQCRNYV